MVTIGTMQRMIRMEAVAEIGNQQWIVAEPGIVACLGNDECLVMGNGMGAERIFARRIENPERP